jgi:ribonuclease HI
MEEIKFEKGEVEWDPDDNKKFQPKTKFNPNARNDRFHNSIKDKIVKTIFTDGGSKIIYEKDKTWYVGAWGFYDEDEDFMKGEAEEPATNNQMELKAVIEAIKYLNKIGVDKEEWVKINLDSNYVRLGILFWVKKWVENDWKRKLKDGTEEEVKNIDLWKELYQLSSERKIYYNRVPGHAGIDGNEKIDTFCSDLIKDKMSELGLSDKKKK